MKKNYVKLWREKARLTQKDLANRLGYSTPQFISNCERGICLMPDEKWPDFKRATGATITSFLNYKLQAVEARIRKGMGLTTLGGK